MTNIFVELPVVDEAYGPDVIQNRTVGLDEEFINFPVGKFAFSSGLIVYDGSWLKTPLTASEIKAKIEKAEEATSNASKYFKQACDNAGTIQDLQSRIDKACEGLNMISHAIWGLGQEADMDKINDDIDKIIANLKGLGND